MSAVEREESNSMADIKRTIRLIVDEGAVTCPICRGVITAGHGHRCSQHGDVIAGCDFKIPVAAQPTS